MTDLNQPKPCVIFDMDGVIFDSEAACLKCWEITAEKYNMQNIRQVFRRCIGTNNAQTDSIVEEAYAGAFGEGFAEQFRMETSRMFHDLYDGGRLPMKPGVVELLEALQAKGFRLGLASSTRKVTVMRELGDAGLTRYFERIIGGDAVTVSKPNPEIYQIACRAMETRPEEAFAIEDSYNGIRAAAAAGMRPIMVPDIIPADDEMRRLSEVICQDLFEVKNYLLNV